MINSLIVARKENGMVIHLRCEGCPKRSWSKARKYFNGYCYKYHVRTVENENCKSVEERIKGIEIKLFLYQSKTDLKT